VSDPQSPLVSVSQMAQASSATAGGNTSANQPNAPAVPAKPSLVSVSDIAKNGIPETTQPSEPEPQGTIAIPAAGRIPGVMMPAPQVTPGQAAAGLAAGAVAGGTVLAGSALPAVLPHTIAGVKAIGSWASANPVSAYLMFQILKEAIPGLKKAAGIISHAPD
jgi:hypothetical protein